MGLEMSDEDVEKMVDKHGEELITEKLQDLRLARRQMRKKRQDRRICLLSEIMGIFSIRESFLQGFGEKSSTQIYCKHCLQFV